MQTTNCLPTLAGKFYQLRRLDSPSLAANLPAQFGQERPFDECYAKAVESGCGAVAAGPAYLLPPLSIGGALLS